MSDSIRMRYIKEWDIYVAPLPPDPVPFRVIDAWIAPLAGHAGDCAKVTTATVTGKVDIVCDCRFSRAVASTA